MKLHHPHDSFAKKALSKLAVAKDLLKAHLSPELVRRIDWNTLWLTNKSYVTEQLSQLHSDVVYSCQVEGKKAYIYCLIEHVRHEVARIKSAQKAVRLHSNLGYHYFGAMLATV